jgi:hypothetical protein
VFRAPVHQLPPEQRQCSAATPAVVTRVLVAPNAASDNSMAVVPRFDLLQARLHCIALQARLYHSATESIQHIQVLCRSMGLSFRHVTCDHIH